MSWAWKSLQASKKGQKSSNHDSTLQIKSPKVTLMITTARELRTDEGVVVEDVVDRCLKCMSLPIQRS